MRRREFLRLAGGAAAFAPVAASAQQPERKRRIGALLNLDANDPLGQLELSAFVRGLQERGWVVGANLQIDYRWGAGNADLYHKYARELVALSPDAILATGGTAVGALQRMTQDIPIVFTKTTDPVSRGLVASLARPGGNTTGFLQYEFSTAGKWLEILKQVVPDVKQVAVVRDVSESSGIGQMAAIQAVAPALRINVTPIDARDGKEIESAIVEFVRQPNGGLIVTESGKSIAHRKLIIALAAKHRLGAVYPYRYFVADGGLISYGPDELDSFKQAAGYIDRILKGDKPAHLPVQTPTNYVLAINLKTAKTLGINVPASLLSSASEVIE